MIIVFYVAAGLTLLTTAAAITRANPVHALLYFVMSLVGMGVIFFSMGAPFAAALEIIVYAGAIMVLFLFVVMMLSLDTAAKRRESGWMIRSVWILPLFLVGGLGIELVRVFLGNSAAGIERIVSPQEVGLRLFTTDLSAVELASILLLTGLIGAFHLGRKDR
ncbi:MAG: NADH-quinone oxidoreductase subunit J [Formivibrio sp.]|nr:NADH-quinone oxidoreductase subunit J [Formivibrio sp.]